LRRQRPQVRLVDQQPGQIDQLVHRLAGHDVVERDQLPGQGRQRRHQVGLGRHDQPEPQLVVDVGGQGRALGQELGDLRVARLAAPLELGDRAAGGAQLLDDAQHLQLDLAEDRVVGDRQAEQRLAPGQVIDDVHHLQHHAGGALVRAGARRDQEQVAGRDVVGDLVGQRQLVDPGQVVDRVGADRLEPVELGVGGRVELAQPQEPIDRGVVGEVELVPVDDRVAA
jgi:hypothetical protein